MKKMVILLGGALILAACSQSNDGRNAAAANEANDAAPVAVNEVQSMGEGFSHPIVDGAGKIYAHATTICMLVERDPNA